MPKPQLPPNQHLAAAGKWPVVGERRQGAPAEPWRLRIFGEVRSPQEWTLSALKQLGSVERQVDIHCVTRWSRLALPVVGLPVMSVLARCQPTKEARFLSMIAASDRGHTTSLPMGELASLDPLIVWEADGKPLSEEHGGPLRIVTPGRYFYKSLKWLVGLELLREDRPGYWEAEAGYHNHADPWQEERYIAAGISRQQAQRLIAGRDFRGQDLLSIDLTGLDLAGLQAGGALLRNANFRNCSLAQADFSQANLSNAHLNQADLTGANLRGSDCEGADFCGAHLLGADLRGASLFGATFCAGEEAGNQELAGAMVDSTTLIDPPALEVLAPRQAAYLTACLARRQNRPNR